MHVYLKIEKDSHFHITFLNKELFLESSYSVLSGKNYASIKLEIKYLIK